MNAEAAARDVATLFPEIYRRLQSRQPASVDLSRKAIAVLDHLAQAGPLTVTETALHFGRAQSAMSEIIRRLQVRGLLDGVKDQRDHRRRLIWLTPKARSLREKVARVLSPEHLAHAMEAMAPGDRKQLVRGMRALVAAADSGRARKGAR